MYLKTVFSVIFLCFMIVLPCFAGNNSKGNTTTYYPVKEGQYGEEQEMQKIEKYVEDYTLARESWLIELIAFRENNKNLCDKFKGEESQDCKHDLEFYIFLKTLASGNCEMLETLSSPMWRDKLQEICEPLNARSCSNIKVGYKRNMCQALLEENPQILFDAVSTSEAIKDMGLYPSEESQRQFISIYSGFKYNNMEKCSKYLRNDSFKDGVTCQFLLARNFKEAKARFFKDLVYYTYVKEYGKGKMFCEKITNPFIRKSCYDPDFSNLENFLLKID